MATSLGGELRIVERRLRLVPRAQIDQDLAARAIDLGDERRVADRGDGRRQRLAELGGLLVLPGRRERVDACESGARLRHPRAHRRCIGHRLGRCEQLGIAARRRRGQAAHGARHLIDLRRIRRAQHVEQRTQLDAPALEALVAQVERRRRLHLVDVRRGAGVVVRGGPLRRVAVEELGRRGPVRCRVRNLRRRERALEHPAGLRVPVGGDRARAERARGSGHAGARRDIERHAARDGEPERTDCDRRGAPFRREDLGQLVDEVVHSPSASPDSAARPRAIAVLIPRRDVRARQRCRSAIDCLAQARQRRAVERPRAGERLVDVHAVPNVSLRASMSRGPRKRGTLGPGSR